MRARILPVLLVAAAAGARPDDAPRDDGRLQRESTLTASCAAGGALTLGAPASALW